jgi:serine/threonine protein phosphatase PrpC
MYIACVGDSRAYLIRRDKIEQLTVDHSLAQALVESKTLTNFNMRRAVRLG